VNGGDGKAGIFDSVEELARCTGGVKIGAPPAAAHRKTQVLSKRLPIHLNSVRDSY